MSIYLQLFIILPIAGFFLSLMIPRKKENVIATLAIATISLQLLGLLVFVAAWLFNGADVLDVRHATLYKTTDFEIFINFFFDKTTAVFAVVGALLCASVAVFSRFYLHREEGFKRFFNNILLFFTGYNIVIFSGNFETLFIGWEFLGISSFLLISFYRDRYLPVKNGMKVISLYRMSDVCLLLAMWLSHHFWHENISFVKMADPVFLTDKLTLHPGMGALIAVALLIAAAAKSAQFPFSSWLPRAMEGPTSSSAIFYGSLSVHIGVFLLLRTFPFWENMTGIRIAIGIVGITTSIIAAYITRVQSTVKTQIAYASVVQIGLIFVEIALGLHVLALVHFSANAFLRTWQLLVSPSVLSYLVHNQFYHFDPSAPKKVNTGFRKISNSLYILSVKEWNLDAMLFRYLWSPFKEIGRGLQGVTTKLTSVILIVLMGIGVYALVAKNSIPVFVTDILPLIFSATTLLLILKAFAERGDARKAWLMIFASQLFMLLAILGNADLGLKEILICLGGASLSAIMGYACLERMHAIDSDILLDKFHGYTFEQPVTGFIFLVSGLGLLGFPVTPTFIGIDLLFSHIGLKQYGLIVFAALSFVFVEIAVLRIYSRVFMGQHKKPSHAIAYRSS